MEPISLALSAVAAIKTGVQMGKDITSLGKEVGQLWGAIDAVNQAHEKKKKNPFKTVEEEAMETFIAKQRAKDLEEELRQIIIYTRGMNAWQELIRMRGEIRRKRIEDEKRRKKERREMLEVIALSVALIVGLGALGVFVWFLWRAKNGG